MRLLPRPLAPLLLALLPGTLLLPAGMPAAQAGEAAPQAAAEGLDALVRELLSPDAVVRAAGRARLERALRSGTDPAELAARLAAALVAQADDPSRWADVLVLRALTGTPAEREQAERLLQALGPWAEERWERARRAAARVEPAEVPAASAPAPLVAPIAPPQAVPPAGPAPLPPQPAPPLPVPGPRGQEPGQAEPRKPELLLDVAAWSVPTKGLVDLRRRLADAAGLGSASPADAPLRADPGAHERWTTLVQQTVDALPLGRGAMGVPGVGPPGAEAGPAGGLRSRAHLGERITYRCCVDAAPGPAWAVRTDAIEAGLSLEARLAPQALELAAVWVAVAQPMPTLRARPAPDVEPIELDRPDWSATRARLHLAEPRRAATLALLLPGLLPDPERSAVLVISLEVAR